MRRYVVIQNLSTDGVHHNVEIWELDFGETLEVGPGQTVKLYTPHKNLLKHRLCAVVAYETSWWRDAQLFARRIELISEVQDS